MCQLQCTFSFSCTLEEFVLPLSKQFIAKLALCGQVCPLLPNVVWCSGTKVPEVPRDAQPVGTAHQRLAGTR
jgi:hypothetical protein